MSRGHIWEHIGWLWSDSKNNHTTFAKASKRVNTDRAQYVRSLSSLITIVMMTLFTRFFGIAYHVFVSCTRMYFSLFLAPLSSLRPMLLFKVLFDETLVATHVFCWPCSSLRVLRCCDRQREWVLSDSFEDAASRSVSFKIASSYLCTSDIEMQFTILDVITAFHWHQTLFAYWHFGKIFSVPVLLYVTCISGAFVNHLL